WYVRNAVRVRDVRGVDLLWLDGARRRPASPQATRASAAVSDVGLSGDPHSLPGGHHVFRRQYPADAAGAVAREPGPDRHRRARLFLLATIPVTARHRRLVPERLDSSGPRLPHGPARKPPPRRRARRAPR